MYSQLKTMRKDNSQVKVLQITDYARLIPYLIYIGRTTINQGW